MEPNRDRSERNWRAFANSIPVIFGWKKRVGCHQQNLHNTSREKLEKGNSKPDVYFRWN